MLTIRLQRTGKKNQADFRIVLAEKAAPVKKKHLEVLGAYNPRKKDFKVNEERVKYWVSQRAELSPTVHNLFVTKGLVEGVKVKAFNVPKKIEDAKVETVSTTSPAETAGIPPILEGEKAEEAKLAEATPASETSVSTETPAA